ncbi:MAG: glutamine--fructose-6-phosphate transaminase (isomerizing) [Euryarchaeota archaeon]|nr:glutamine--fructose-6-phosphate transaminase (isomerizing) [Euryarchaeota archaeon]
MCGIVGYIGNRQALPILVESLKRLEYRGYDSAGVSVIDRELFNSKAAGRITELEKRLPDAPGRMGIAHTRWATHGRPSDRNAHPFTDCSGRISLVHNGIIENHRELRAGLESRGHRFTSETDTETVVHLVEENYKGDLRAAVSETVRHLRGSLALAVVHLSEPDRIVVARDESPLVIGLGQDENFVASDLPALLKYTRRVIYLQNREVAVIRRDGVGLESFEGEPVERDIATVDWSPEDTEKGGYQHFMLKEIYEQPRAILESLIGRIPGLELDIGGIDKEDFDSVKIVACGTSFHAGLVGKYVLEQLTGLPVIVEAASEYRYSANTRYSPLMVLVSQSGESADTLQAAREARRRGSRTLAITNVVGSSITREVDSVLYTRAGPEIGVAATKTFTSQLIALYLLGMAMGKHRGTLLPSQLQELIDGLRKLPRDVQSVLDNRGAIKLTAEWMAQARDVFFIGRNVHYPTALEGALKLKEISYIHAEGLPAGELKHGPNALLTAETPVVAIAIRDHTYDKMLSNIGEVSARSAPVIAIGLENDRELKKASDLTLYVPEVRPVLSPVPVITTLQLLAYHVALIRGCEIDKPRNLAKSVTVE